MRLPRVRFTARRMVVAIAFVGLCLGAYVAWQSGGVRVTLKNLGPTPLSDVVIYVTGNAYPVGELEVGGSRTVPVRPRGESHVEVGFTEPKGKRSRLIADCYFEGHSYEGVITVELESGAIKRVDDQVSTAAFGFRWLDPVIGIKWQR